MNKSKILSSITGILIVIICAITLHSCQSNIPKYQIGKDMSYLIIKPGDDRQNITSIIKEFKMKKNIDVDLSKSVYNTQDKLYKLDLQVKNKKSTTGKSASPFNEAIAILITNDQIKITTPEEVKKTIF